MTIDEGKLNEFMGKIVGDLGVTMSSALLVLGDRLGLYKAMAALGPDDAGRARQAHRDGAALRARVARRPGRRRLRHLRRRRPAATRCRPSRRSRSPTTTARPRSRGVFRSRGRCGARSTRWRRTSAPAAGSSGGTSTPACSRGPSDSSAPATSATWSASWIPALDGRQGEAREAGAKVADVGCGCGASTILMAKAFPKSTFRGFDYHQGSIDIATKRAQARRASPIA